MGRRGPSLKQYRNTRRAEERNNRLAWYLYEHGRPPTVDELFFIREHLEDTNPRYYQPPK